MITDKEIGLNVQIARYRLGLTQSDVAAAMDLPRSTISKIEAGVRAVTASELPRLAAALHTEVESLLMPQTAEQFGRVSSATILLRAERVSPDDALQLFWFAEVAGTLPATPSGCERAPERIRKLPLMQSGEMAARWLRAQVSLNRTDPVLSMSGLAEKVGITTVAARLPSRSRVSACLMTDSRGAAAFINANHPLSRRRFSLAHEVGHRVLGDAPAPVACSFSQKGGRRSSAELRADVFASAFLLPTQAVKALSSITVESIADFAAAFGASTAAVTGRLAALGALSRGDAQVVRRLSIARPMDPTPAYRTVGERTAAYVLGAQMPHLLEGTAVVPAEEVVR